MRLAIFLACALSLSACSDALTDSQGSFAEPDLSGSLRIPLLVEDAEGESYRLRGADFEISGSAMLSMSDRNGVRARESLVTRLPPGQYTVFLRPGWRLMQRGADGTEKLASAALLSPNPVTLDVSELGDESVRLVFQKDGKELRLGGSTGVRVTRADQSASPNTL
jgi:hypothetical protein